MQTCKKMQMQCNNQRVKHLCWYLPRSGGCSHVAMLDGAQHQELGQHWAWRYSTHRIMIMVMQLAQWSAPPPHEHVPVMTRHSGVLSEGCWLP